MRYEEHIERARMKHGERFDPRDLAPQFAAYLGTDQRIRVQTTYPNGETWTRTGTVGVTTGWRPAFLLMRRRTDHGSSDVLRPDDRIIAVQRGRTYEPVA